MNRSGRFAVVSENDSYRHTEPMGRPFDGSVPRFHPSGSQAWPPQDSNPYPYGRPPVRPIPVRVIKDGHPQPVAPPAPSEPFIASLATAKNTHRIARELVAIRWLLIVIILAIGAMLFCEIEMAVRLSTLLNISNSQF